MHNKIFIKKLIILCAIHWFLEVKELYLIFFLSVSECFLNHPSRFRHLILEYLYNIKYFFRVCRKVNEVIFCNFNDLRKVNNRAFINDIVKRAHIINRICDIPSHLIQLRTKTYRSLFLFPVDPKLPIVNKTHMRTYNFPLHTTTLKKQCQGFSNVDGVPDAASAEAYIFNEPCGKNNRLGPEPSNLHRTWPRSESLKWFI